MSLNAWLVAFFIMEIGYNCFFEDKAWQKEISCPNLWQYYSLQTKLWQRIHPIKYSDQGFTEQGRGHHCKVLVNLLGWCWLAQQANKGSCIEQEGISSQKHSGLCQCMLYKEKFKQMRTIFVCWFSEISAGIVVQLQISNYRHVVLHELHF